MSSDAVALAGVVVAAFSAIIAGVWAFARRHANAEIAKLQTENAIQASEAKREHTARIDRLEQDLATERTHAESLATQVEQITYQHKSLLSGRTGVILKVDIDHQLSETMQVLGTSAASVLVPAPPPNDQTSLVFLSIFGPAAHRIRHQLVLIEPPRPDLPQGHAGKVFKTGVLINSSDPRHDPDWNPAVDAVAESETETLLTAPVKLRGNRGRVLAVCQFLNKHDGKAFSQQDERVAEQVANRISSQVHEFLSDERNYEVLGIPLDQPDQDATVMFCDLTSSTDLLRLMNTPNALFLLDEYLESLGEIALAHGAKLVASLGDGMLLSFNVPKPLDNHVQRAVDAAWEMQRDFRRIWRGWQQSYNLRHLHNRISIASGLVVLAPVGPKQYRQETIFGQVVNDANKLCRIAPRDQDVIIVDNAVAKGASGYQFEEFIPDLAQAKLPSQMFRVMGRS